MTVHCADAVVPNLAEPLDQVVFSGFIVGMASKVTAFLTAGGSSRLVLLARVTWGRDAECDASLSG